MRLELPLLKYNGNLGNPLSFYIKIYIFYQRGLGVINNKFGYYSEMEIFGYDKPIKKSIYTYFIVNVLYVLYFTARYFGYPPFNLNPAYAQYNRPGRCKGNAECINY